MGILLRDISLIYILVHCCIMFMFLYESKYSKKTTNIATGILMLLLVIINMYSVLTLGMEKAGQLIVFTCVLPSFVFFYIMAKNRDTRFLFTFCLVDTIILEILIGTKLLDEFLGFENNVTMFISRLLLLPALEFIIVKFLRKPYHRFQQLLEGSWGLFSLLSILFYAALIVYAFVPSIITDRAENYPSIIILLIIIPVMYIIIFRIMSMQITSLKKEKELQVLNLRIKMAQERIESSESSIENIKIKRHDMKHSMLLLYDYIENGELDKAKECINNINSDIDKNSPKNFCRNHSVNVVLSYYDKTARNYSIKIDTNINLPEKLSTNEMDMAVVLSNAMDNAINELKHCKNKTIYINAFIEGELQYWEIKNSCESKPQFENGLPLSNKKNHGYGTKSIAHLIENMNGIYSFAIEDDMFVFRCAI